MTVKRFLNLKSKKETHRGVGLRAAYMTKRNWKQLEKELEGHARYGVSPAWAPIHKLFIDGIECIADKAIQPESVLFVY